MLRVYNKVRKKKIKYMRFHEGEQEIDKRYNRGKEKYRIKITTLKN